MLTQPEVYPINVKWAAAMANSSSAKRANARYVFIFGNSQYQDQHTIDFIMNMTDAGLEVKVIDTRRGVDHGQHPLKSGITLDQAIGFAQHAACVLLPYDKDFLGLILDLPDIEVFLKEAAKNDAHFISHTEIVAQFALDKTTDQSIDMVYPIDEAELGHFMAQAAVTLKHLMGKQ